MVERLKTPSGLPAISPTRGEKTRGSASVRRHLRDGARKDLLSVRICLGAIEKGCGRAKPSPLWRGFGRGFVEVRNGRRTDHG